MKKILLTILLGVTLNVCAQTPPGFKGAVYSDISSNGYEWVNVDGKEHAVPPKGTFCMAEVKSATLAPKFLEASVWFDKYLIAGYYGEETCSKKADIIWSEHPTTAIFWMDSKEPQTWPAIIGVENQSELADSTFYITCLTNISPKSNMYVKAIQPDLLNLGKIQR